MQPELPEHPELLIGIPTFNRSKGLDYLLQSILINSNSKDIRFKISICQDSANIIQQDLTINVINKYSNLMNITYIQNKKNLGVSSSWNNIIRSDQNNCPYIILLNDDIIVEKDSIKNMLYFIKNNSNIGTVGYELNMINEEDIPKILAGDDIKPKIDHTAIGSFFGFSRKQYNLVNGFDEFYYMTHEETDFSAALYFKGFPSYNLSCPKSYHIGAATRSKVKYDVQSNQNHFKEKWKVSAEEMNELIKKKSLDMTTWKKVKWMCKNKHYETLSLKELKILCDMR